MILIKKIIVKQNFLGILLLNFKNLGDVVCILAGYLMP